MQIKGDEWTLYESLDFSSGTFNTIELGSVESLHRHSVRFMWDLAGGEILRFIVAGASD